MTSIPTTHTQIVESNKVIEDCIMQAIVIFHHQGEKQNTTIAAREVFVLESRLHERWNGRQSQYDGMQSNIKLSEG
jgi:hypothetical protein